MSSHNSAASLGSGSHRGGGSGSGREAEQAPEAGASAAQIPDPASTLGAARSSVSGSNIHSESRTTSHLLSSHQVNTSTPDAADFWNNSAPSQLISRPDPGIDIDYDIGFWGFAAYGLTDWIPEAATQSSTSEGAALKSNLDTDNPRVSVPEPSTSNNTLRESVQGSIQPLMPGFLRVSVPPTPLTPSNTPDLPVHGFAPPSVPSSSRGSFQVLPTPNNTRQVSLEGSTQLLTTSSPWVPIRRSVPLSNSSLSSVSGYPRSSAFSSSRSSVQESVTFLSFPRVPVQGSPLTSVRSSPRSSVQESVTFSDSSLESIQGSPPPSVLSSQSSVQGSVTFYGSSQESVQESAAPSVPNSLPGSVQRPLMRTNSSRALAQGSTQPGTLRILVEGSTPPPDSPRVSIQGYAPPSMPGSARLWVEKSAPPPGSPQESVEESASPLASLSPLPTPGEIVNQSMASREKASVEGHKFDVVVIGGGISG